MELQEVLSKLTGTEKQIKWAETIIAEVWNNLNNNIRRMEEQSEISEDHRAVFRSRLEGYRAVRDSFEKVCTSKHDAKFWIENQTSFSFRQIQNLVSEYELKNKNEKI